MTFLYCDVVVVTYSIVLQKYKIYFYYALFFTFLRVSYNYYKIK
ncbi:hypothetical protein HMPREF9019_0602 [Hoylesella timonensis CRIS 5C-B1]|uniref:Uncharacterized protein n=1 Tax=Hoylesella timonensis CRIS 5C-B1 TaxID=679189 RepID=D1VX38_9BACT|nr:hypothetical protein HMPREF9019_0602 [Hoylesella timonensis CRIS 5C-B1]